MNDQIKDTDLKNLTYNDVVPQQRQNQLLLLRDIDTKTRFTIGDIANDLYDHPVVAPFALTRELVQRSVGHFVGKSARTVKAYADVARQVDSAMREEFENLAFAHFAFAARPENRPRMREILTFAATHNSSPDALEVAFLNGQVTGKAPLQSPASIGYYNGSAPATPAPGSIYYDNTEELYEGFKRSFVQALPKDLAPEMRLRLNLVLKQLHDFMQDAGIGKKESKEETK